MKISFKTTQAFMLTPHYDDVEIKLLDGAKAVKARLKTVVLEGHDVFGDFHNPADLNSDGWWKNFHRKSGGEHTLDFGGDHTKVQSTVPGTKIIFESII